MSISCRPVPAATSFDDKTNKWEMAGSYTIDSHWGVEVDSLRGQHGMARSGTYGSGCETYRRCLRTDVQDPGPHGIVITRAVGALPNTSANVVRS